MEQNKNYLNSDFNGLNFLGQTSNFKDGLEILGEIHYEFTEDTTLESLTVEYGEHIPNFILIDWLASQLPEVKETRRLSN